MYKDLDETPSVTRQNTDYCPLHRRYLLLAFNISYFDIRLLHLHKWFLQLFADAVHPSYPVIMHTLSTLRFPSMNNGSTRATLRDYGQVLRVNPTNYVGDLIGSDLLHGHQSSTLCHFANLSGFNGSNCLHPTHHEGEGSTTDNVWYCPSCGDGPIPDWNSVCVNCDFKKNAGCCAEGSSAHHDILHGFLEDGPETGTSWFCGSCGDGPMQDWNPCCPSCGHKRDSCCKTESH